MEPGVRDINRLQKAYEAAERIPIGSLSSYKHSSQLYRLRLQNIEKARQQISNQERKKNYQQQMSPATDSRWSIFKALPVLESPQEPIDFSRKYDQMINQFKVKMKKEAQSKRSSLNMLNSRIPKPNQVNENENGEKKQMIFNIGANNNGNSPVANNGQYGGKKTAPIMESGVRLNENMPKVDLFSKKINVNQDSLQEKPIIKANSGLFSEKNPWQNNMPQEKKQVNILKLFGSNNEIQNKDNKVLPGLNIFGSNNKGDIKKSENILLKSNIFSKNLVAPQVPPVEKLETSSGLFSQKNPWTQGQGPKNMDSSTFKIGVPNNFVLNQNNKSQQQTPNPPANTTSNLSIFSKPGLVNFGKKEENQPSSNLFNQSTLKGEDKSQQKNEVSKPLFNTSSPQKLFSTPIMSGPQGKKNQFQAQSQSTPLFPGGFFQNKFNPENAHKTSQSGGTNIFAKLVEKKQFAPAVQDKKTSNIFGANDNKPSSYQPSKNIFNQSKVEFKQQKPSLFALKPIQVTEEAQNKPVEIKTNNPFKTNIFQKANQSQKPKQPQIKIQSNPVLQQNNSQVKNIFATQLETHNMNQQDTHNIFAKKIFQPTTQQNNIFNTKLQTLPKNLYSTPQQQTPQSALFSQPQTNFFGKSNITTTKEEKQQQREEIDAGQKNIFNQSTPGAGSNIFQKKGNIFGVSTGSNVFQNEEQKNLKVEEQQSSNSNLKSEKKNVRDLFQNLSQKPNIFPTGNTNIFSNKTENKGFPSLQPTGSLFNKQSDKKNIFGGTPQGSLFAKTEKVEAQKQGEQSENGYEADSGPIEAVDEADPSKSTGNYQYEQVKTLYKEVVLKLRKGNEQIRENVTVSVEKHPKNTNLLIFVRLQNKCIYFYGTYHPQVTQIIEITPNSYQNISVKKLMVVKDNQTSLELVKIKFKDEKSGKAFKDAFKQQ